MYRVGVGGNPFRVHPTNFRAMAMKRDADGANECVGADDYDHIHDNGMGHDGVAMMMVLSTAMT